ncbi:MAG: glycosyltransferase family 2 protein [Trichocoleus desertorum ATA4-8-CV12]|jgi:glycosyltransferase involved in cell wall biosynthesis|nr:glycosyltransferase family 2 protein [Trichocoleus desertorum ATA4-8-CV12]
MCRIEKLPVHIIIPVHNRRRISLSCLCTLHKVGDLQRYHTFIVDDGSTDGSAEAIQKEYPDVQILKGDGNLWWTGAIHKGMAYAYEQGAEFLIWLNDDCRVEPGAIADLVSFCRERPKAIVGAQGFETDSPNQLSFGGKVKTWKGYRFIQPTPGQVIPCDLLSGNLVCIPRAVVDAIGYPDCKITPHYGGDSLYLIRAQKAGFQLFVDTRHAAWNLPGEPRLYPSNWLLADGDPLKILKLVFVLQSGLSWRVWWQLNWEAYGLWGLVMFCKKYASIVLISAMRLLPIGLRQRGAHLLKTLNS